MADQIETAVRAVLGHPWGSGPWTAHTEHRFHGECAVCRGDVRAILAVAASAGAPVRAEQNEAAIARYVDLLAAIWLYISWRYVTRQLTTEQKDLFADAVEESMRRANAEDPDLNLPVRVDRWWRDAAPAADAEEQPGGQP